MDFASVLSFVVVECCECGLAFGVSAVYQQERCQDHKPFYCPAGHAQGYPAETDEDKLRRQNGILTARTTALEDQLDASWRSKAAVQRHLNRVQHRISAGVCPCCNRTFKELARHMKSQHPTYAEETT